MQCIRYSVFRVHLDTILAKGAGQEFEWSNLQKLELWGRGILKLQTIHYNKISNEMVKVQSPMLVLHVAVVYGWLLNYCLIAKAFTLVFLYLKTKLQIPK